MFKSEDVVVKPPSRFDAHVDIIVPFHGQYEHVAKLVESIFRYTRSNYYRLCLVDDGSPNRSFGDTMSKAAMKRDIKHFSILRSDEHRGFAAACELGFISTQNPFVCFMHSDCRVDNIGWLRHLGECLLRLKDQGVRMVSPKTNNSEGGDPAQVGVKTKAIEDVILEGESYLSMYCVLCQRALFEKCGGFIKKYPYAFYENQEFAMRMKKYNFKQAVCGDSWIYHFGAATIQQLWQKAKIRKIMRDDNKKMFLEDAEKLKS